MPSSRREFLLLAPAIGATALTSAGARAFADTYPSRSIRLVVGFASGGATDFDARLIAEKVGSILGQSVIVENKPGANGAIAAQAIARAEPDGYSLFFSNFGAIAINPILRADLAYKPLTDFTPVTLLVRNAVMLAVKSSAAANDARDFAALAKQKPGEVTVGVTGIGAMTDLTLELYQSVADIKLRTVPYRGAAEALTALIGGQIDGMFGEFPLLGPQLKSGTVKALAIASPQRSQTAPEVKTFVEQGYASVIAENWSGVLAPANTPAAIVTTLNAAFVAALSDPDVARKLQQSGVVPSPTTPDEFAKLMRSETERWAAIIRERAIDLGSNTRR
jgi:tripartite-type tricarboxylate transporter receptor subunit TctC